MFSFFFFGDRPAVSRGSKAPPKVRQLDRQRDSGKKRRNQQIQVIQIDLLTTKLYSQLHLVILGKKNSRKYKLHRENF